MLNSYLAQVQRFCADQKFESLDTGNITDYINRARREIAGMTQCIRRLTPISGAISTATVINGGSNYTNPTVTITPPDFPSGAGAFPNGAQATALPIVQGGIITAVDIQYGGSGYFQPIATVTDATGSGASISLTVPGINLLQANQEQYPLANIDLSAFPGVASVYNIHTVSVIYANYRYNLPKYSFPVYQGFVRTYPFQYTYVPTFCSQVDRGTSGILFCYPWPSQVYQVEFYCACLPQDLIDDQSVEALPQPWVDCVPYFAAHLAFAEMQNLNASKYYLDLFDKMVIRKSGYKSPGRVTNIYGRW